jgi:hypothetical protein
VVQSMLGMVVYVEGGDSEASLGKADCREIERFIWPIWLAVLTCLPNSRHCWPHYSHTGPLPLCPPAVISVAPEPQKGFLFYKSARGLSTMPVSSPDLGHLSLMLPKLPFSYPRDDQGPHATLTQD